MKHTASILLLLLAIPASSLFAQNSSVRGTVLDSSRQPVPGVSVMLLKSSDTTKVLGAVTDVKGRFTIADVPKGAYRLRISHIAYAEYRKTVIVRDDEESIGTFALMPKAIAMGDVVIEGQAKPVEQKGDTVQFNAGAYKTAPEATAEDLVAKLPGVTVQEGTVTHQGEQVKNVLVDNKPFFGDDPTLALRNLPADMVDKMQIYDKLSDQAEFTGFDDGSATKTLNIITRASRRVGHFGQFYGGAGPDEKYNAGANYNFFEGATRVSAIGVSNNVNMQNFSTMDLLGSFASSGGLRGLFGGGRGGGGGGGGMFFGGGGGGGGLSFLGQQNGINTTHSLGANYSDLFSNDALYVNFSYFVASTSTDKDQTTDREYLLGGSASQLYNERTVGDSRSLNHRLNARVEWTIDSLSELTVSPRFSWQGTENNSRSIASTSLLSSLLGSSSSLTNSDGSGYNASANATYRRQLGVRGRTISLSVNASGNDQSSDNLLQASSLYAASMGAAGDTVGLDQWTGASTNGYGISSNLAYTEPLGTNQQLQATYAYSYTQNTRDKRTSTLDSATGIYSRLEEQLSSVLDNGYRTHSAGAAYRIRNDWYNLQFQLQYQRASLSADQTYPSAGRVEKTFSNVLPSAQLNFKLSSGGNMRFNYRSSTNAPSVSQLQTAVDNSNTLLLTTGNPDLKQSLSHTVFTRFNMNTFNSMSNLFLNLWGSLSQDYIGNATIVADRDTTLSNGIFLQQGSQLTTPANLDGYRNLRGNLTYSMPVELIATNLSINGGVSYTRTPGLQNGIATTGTTTAMNGGVTLASNISKDLDFNVSYFGSKNFQRNSLTASNSDYWSHMAFLRFNWTFWAGFVFRTDLRYQAYTGLGSSYDRDYTVWNASIGKKFFSDQSAEITLSVYDILKQNDLITRTATDTYIENSHPVVLGQYFLCTFTYRLRSFNMSDQGPDGPPPGGPRPGHIPGFGPGPF